MAQPRYVIARERGPEHSKTFTIEVRVGKDLTAQADGHSKKDASQKAAKEMYLKMSSERSDGVVAVEEGLQGLRREEITEAD
jgi:dsRNA-specific ribonuclease